MKMLVVEDEFTCRLLLQEHLRPYGTTHAAVTGKEAVEAVKAAMDASDPYDLICMDVMMPEMDGQEAVVKIRAMEKERGVSWENGVKIVMTTALDDVKNVSMAYGNLCDGYLVKPIHQDVLTEELKKLGLA
jgi:two-component system, chemotaxis family, chemotaxis protein CheY